MALLTRRAFGAAGASVLAGLASGKQAGAQEPGAQEPGAQEAGAQEAGAPQVDMRPLTDIVPARPPAALPPATFSTLDGASRTLADYAGKPVLLNFWATWCVPCVAELPELDRLAASGGFAVLAVSADRGGAATVRPFAASHHLDHLVLLTDQGSDAVHALGIAGFPTTLLIGIDGRLRGTLEGPAAWGDAKATLLALLG